MRFSLRWLLLAVSLLAVGVVALINANLYWFYAAQRCRLLLLSVAVVSAIYLKGAARAFWLGSLVFGLIDMRPPVSNQVAHELFGWLHSHVVQEREIVSNGRTLKVWLPTYEFFDAVADCIQTVIIGTLGGCLAVWLYSRRELQRTLPKQAN